MSSNPPGLMGDTSSHSSIDDTPSSPELIDRDDDATPPLHGPAVNGLGEIHELPTDGVPAQIDKTKTHDSNSSSTVSAAAMWDDDKLRAFFDSSSDIRDLLVVVYDKSDVPPVGPDHPVAGQLFREQNAKLAEITTVSNDWLFAMLCNFVLAYRHRLSLSGSPAPRRCL